jgi:hypothetical protein
VNLNVIYEFIKKTYKKVDLNLDIRNAELNFKEIILQEEDEEEN